jgi:putative salt-induced outer membrane protein YdiY
MIPSALLPLLLAIPASETAPAPVSAEPTALLAQGDAEGVWKGSVNLGAIITTGNSKTEAASAAIDTGWKTAEHALSLNFLWNYQGTSTTTGSEITQRKVFAKLQYDKFLSAATYAYGNLAAEHDFTAALDLRSTVGAGLGHEFRSDDDWDLSGELGLSYIDDKYLVSTDDNEYLSARVAYKAEYKGSEKWGLTHEGEIFPSLEDGDNVHARWDSRAKTNLTETMFAQLQWVYTYNNVPATGSDRVDNLFALTLGWTF